MKSQVYWLESKRFLYTFSRQATHTDYYLLFLVIIIVKIQTACCITTNIKKFEASKSSFVPIIYIFFSENAGEYSRCRVLMLQSKQPLLWLQVLFTWKKFTSTTLKGLVFVVLTFLFLPICSFLWNFIN